MRNEIVSEARSWIGTPYHHLGSIKSVGVDCAMLLVEVYKTVGLIPSNVDPRPYAPEWHLHRDEEAFLAWLKDFADEVDTPESGDMVVWKFGRAYSHGGIVVGDSGEIVHAYKDARMVTLGHLSEGLLARQKSKFFKLRGID
jgi:cell wall-associated NlpC family hydrolase